MSSTNVHELEKLRCMGRFEQWTSARCDTGCVYNVGLSCSYSAPDGVDIKSAIFSSLSFVIIQHPILCAIPVDLETENPYFASLPVVDLEKVVKFYTRKSIYNGDGADQELDELLIDQLQISLEDKDGSLPFWRLLVLKDISSPRDFIATFIFDHALGDGTTGAIFHTSFFSAIQESHSPPPTSIMQSPPMPLLPNIELIHDLDDNPTRQPRITTENLWSGAPICTPVIGRFRTTVIAKTVTDAFVKKCREKQTTVTAALQILLASALFRSITEEEFTHLRAIVPINIRRFLPSPITASSMGVFIDVIGESYHREESSSFSWSEARGARNAIADYLAWGGVYLGAVSWLKHVLGLKACMRSCVGQKREGSFEVSNLGFVAADMQDGKDGWGAGRMVFGRSASYGSSALGCGVVTGPDGCLVLGYTWQEGVVEEDLVGEVMENVEKEIVRLSA